MRRHRTTARGVIALLLLLGLPAAVAAAYPSPGHVATSKKKHHGKQGSRIVFPVVGSSQYTNDFGSPRGQGPHQGIDIMAKKKSLAVAAEAGTVEFWTHSGSAGCMIYLRGSSGTTYYYIHLNNDLTSGNDNRGRCAAGTAYAPKLRSGDHVEAGELIGYVGDSGDANGVASHLHFEVHPHGGNAVSPFRYLNRGRRLLFSVVPGAAVKVLLHGSVVSRTNSSLTVRVSSLRAWPGSVAVSRVNRNVTVSVPTEATILQKISERGAAALTTLRSATPGRGVAVVTSGADRTLGMLLGQSGSLAAAQVLLAAKK